ncbi:MAG: hypothetical protein JNK14_20705 [Chitinophagaceae bacterium]|nr:hypothetical protein [Chitinophagaceae bacterium]
MKTAACILVLLSSSLVLNAQLSKGQWMVGGATDFSYRRSKDNIGDYSHIMKQTSYRVLPGAGYFFMNRLCAGIRLNISGMKAKWEYNDVVNSNSLFFFYESTFSGIGFSPFVRYYILPSVKKFNVLAEASYAYNTEKVKITEREAVFQPGGPASVSERKSNNTHGGHYYSLSAGPALFINKKISVELTVGYTAIRVNDWIWSTNRITIGTGFHIFIGK